MTNLGNSDVKVKRNSVNRRQCAGQNMLQRWKQCITDWARLWICQNEGKPAARTRNPSLHCPHLSPLHWPGPSGSKQLMQVHHLNPSTHISSTSGITSYWISITNFPGLNLSQCLARFSKMNSQKRLGFNIITAIITPNALNYKQLQFECSVFSLHWSSSWTAILFDLMGY